MKWLEGKKTYIGAAVLIAAGLAGYWYGLMNPAEATALMGFGLTAIGLGDKFTRYIPMILAALDKLQQRIDEQKKKELGTAGGAPTK